MPNQEADTVAQLLVREVVCRLGVPLLIHSDQGRNFESTLVTEMCQLLNIKKTRTTPYHPQSDGMVERFNRTLEMQLSKFADHNQKDWDVHIPYLLMAYRSAVHETTGCSSSRMMLGRELRLPTDLMFVRPEQVLPACDHTQTLQERLERVHEFARLHMKCTTDRMKDRYDLPEETQQFESGDAVWLHNPQRRKGLSPKLQRPWQGLYVVIKKINDLVYRIQLNPRTKPKVVHRNRLWRYGGANPPTWFHATTSTHQSEPPQPDHSSAITHEHQPMEPPRRSNRSRRPPDRYGD